MFSNQYNKSNSKVYWLFPWVKNKCKIFKLLQGIVGFHLRFSNRLKHSVLDSVWPWIQRMQTGLTLQFIIKFVVLAISDSIRCVDSKEG